MPRCLYGGVCSAIDLFFRLISVIEAGLTGIGLDFRSIFGGMVLDALLVRGYAAIDLFSRLISVIGAGLTGIGLDFRSVFGG